MPHVPLTRPLLERLAARFRALGEVNRLAILSALLAGERSVTELLEATGLGQANVSKHLLLLYQEGFVTRRKEGLHVYYSLADEDVFHICDLMCGRLQRETRDLGALLESEEWASRAGRRQS
jgi:DNA-binding transcriptional ArsR family regulator